MINIFRRYSIVFTTLFFFLFSLQLMRWSVQYPELPRFGGRAVLQVFSPLDQLRLKLSNAAQFHWSRYIWLVGLEEQLKEGEERIKKLESENTTLNELLHENRRLKELLDIKPNLPTRKVVGRVIARESVGSTRSITVDVGRESGLKEGLPVVNGQGVVGQVVVVAQSSSRVLLLTDHTSSIDAVVQRSRISGLVEGLAGNTLNMNYVAADGDILPGDRIVASGLDGVFHKGSPIGVVTSVEEQKGALFKRVLLKPVVDYRKLESILVLVPELAVEAVD